MQNKNAVLDGKTGLIIKKQRYLSLDVLRGLTICLMIIVNTPGSWSSVYAPFLHAPWHGFTITDLVFPTFLFVVGNAMSFSLKKFKDKPEANFLRKVAKRTALIFLIGLFLNYFPFVFRNELNTIELKNLLDIRIMGVLQRIALCYGIAALVIHYLSKKGIIIFSVLTLLGYWAIMFYFGSQPTPYSLENNAALKFDYLLIPIENLYGGYGIPFDPEGLLSTLPAVINVIIGYFAGYYIQKFGNKNSTVLKLVVSGVLLIGIALVWDPFFPINKPIWTSSYVLYSSGFTLLTLAILMWLIEVKKFQNWTYFFEVFGRNPLFIYILSGLFIKLMSLITIDGESLTSLVYQNLFLSWTEGKNASLLFAIFYMLVLWLIGYFMDKKKIYIKV